MIAVLLHLAPGIVLLVALVLGRYPGERSIDELRRRVNAAPPARARRAPQRRWPPRGAPPHRRGLLLDAAIAARPPPAG